MSIENLLSELTAAINGLTKALNEKSAAPVTEAVGKAEKNTRDTEKASTSKPDKSPADVPPGEPIKANPTPIAEDHKAISAEAIREALKNVARKAGPMTAGGIVKKFGSVDVTGLNVADYPAVLKVCSEVING